MTAADLIARLSKFPPDALVGHISTGGVYDTVEIVQDMDDYERRHFGVAVGVVLL